MAAETKKTTSEAPPAAEVKVVHDVPVAEEAAPEKPTAAVVEGEKKEEVVVSSDEKKIAESISFKEESNKVDDLIDPEKKALDEFKLLVQEALNKHEFTAPPPPPPAKEEEKKEEEVKPEEKKEEEVKIEEKKEVAAEVAIPAAAVAVPAKEATPAPAPAAAVPAKEATPTPVPAAAVPAKEATPTPVPAAAVPAKEATPTPAPAAAVPTKEATPTPAPVAAVPAKEVTPAPAPSAAVPVKEVTPPPVAASMFEKVVNKVQAVVEEIKETIVHEVTPPAPPPTEEPAAAPVAVEEIAAPPPPPEEVSIWGIPLLADERSDVILLKFLRARDFKVKEALAMLKSVVAWRKEFKIDELVEEEGICEGLEKAVYIHGVDKEGHLVAYNCFGEFQDKELYNKTFADSEKRTKFLRWYIQFLEKNIRKLDFTPEGTSTIVQITDLKNVPGLILFKKELRQATNQALQLLQDNYPEFVAKQVFINVPWWYVAYNRMISPFLTQRTKSKFVFAGPTKTVETLFKYIAPEHVPVQYGGLNKEGELTPSDAATEEIIKPTSKHTIELPITEGGTLVWEVRVVGWEVSYEAEFVPSAEGAYTWIVQKARKIGPSDEQVISYTFKTSEPGKIVLTFDNQTSKKKKLLFRSKTKVSE